METFDFKPDDCVKHLCYINTTGKPADTKEAYNVGYIKECHTYQVTLCIMVTPFFDVITSAIQFKDLIKINP